MFDYYSTQGNKNKYIDPLFSLVNGKNNPQLLMLLEYSTLLLVSIGCKFRLKRRRQAHKVET